jgi:hypothetical protein
VSKEPRSILPDQLLRSTRHNFQSLHSNPEIVPAPRQQLTSMGLPLPKCKSTSMRHHSATLANGGSEAYDEAQLMIDERSAQRSKGWAP